MNNEQWDNQNNNNPNNSNNNNNGERPPLLRAYNIIDWVDFLLIAAIVMYFVNPDLFDFFPHMGLLFAIASLAVSVTAVVIATKIYRQGLNMSKIRLIVRYIIWGFWIPFDIILIARFFVLM